MSCISVLFFILAASFTTPTILAYYIAQPQPHLTHTYLLARPLIRIHKTDSFIPLTLRSFASVLLSTTSSLSMTIITNPKGLYRPILAFTFSSDLVGLSGSALSYLISLVDAVLGSCKASQHRPTNPLKPPSPCFFNSSTGEVKKERRAMTYERTSAATAHDLFQSIAAS